MREYFMSTNEETIVVDIDDVDSLIGAMRYKAAHIKAKADPEIFEAVADMLEKSVEVVRCKDCKHWEHMIDDDYICFFMDSDNPVWTDRNDFCSYGERKEE